MPFLEKLSKIIFMRLRKFLSVFIILFSLCGNTVFADNIDNADNYLIGMTVSKVKEGFYTVSLQFKNDTKEQFEAKDMGNNTYTIMLPQIKSVMGDENITFSDDKPDIDVTVSEGANFTNNKKFHTKIKFKTPEESSIQVLSYGQSDVSAAIEDKIKTEDKKQNNITMTFQEISDWLLYFSIGVILLLAAFLCLQKKSNDDDEQTEEAYEAIKQPKNIPITERNNAVFEALSKNEPPKETLKDFQIRKEQEEQEFSHDETDETEKIIDELVQIVIPKNDLVLMPGVPELPGLEQKEKKNKTTKTVLDNVKVDLFDAEDFTETKEKSETSEQMSLSDRIKAKESQVSDKVVQNERNEILNNISPLGDIPETSAEKEKTTIEEVHIPDEYEKLLEAYKKTLKIAHKIKDGDDVDPEVTDAFAVDENTGFSLVKLGEKISLVGNIGEKLFVIKTFTPQELNNDTLFMEFCTQTPTYCAYSVILNNFKALVKVTPTEISLIGDYGE